METFSALLTLCLWGKLPILWWSNRLSWLQFAWWRHQMKTFSALLALCEGNSPFTGEFPSQKPVTQSFDVFFDLRRNKRLSKPSRRRWFETPSRSLWLHCNGCLGAHLLTGISWASTANILDWSQRYFAHVTTVTLSWRVQNIVVIGRVYFTLKCFEFSSNFEFDRNMLSGTGARIRDYIHVWEEWGVITGPYPNINGGSARPPLKLLHGWVIISNMKLWMWFLTHALISVKWLQQKGPLVPGPSICQADDNTCRRRVYASQGSEDLSWVLLRYKSRIIEVIQIFNRHKNFGGG